MNSNIMEKTVREKTVDIFGSNVFSDSVMRERLPKNTYKALKNTMEKGYPLEPLTAEVVASAMKDWAIEKGATHFTHWFQPMTGITAEKHDSFISLTNEGKVLMEFSGKELIKGEPDASSFPSGGLRATFEARGYTAWDCTSPAFIKDATLYIPTAFCSYTGEALDKKTPLLRSMEALSKQAMRLLKLFGNNTSSRIITTVGPEQEYFLIDKEMFDKRRDIIYTGRTLFGAKPPKGQELEDHYFVSLRERISMFMQDLDRELWRLGVSAKTKHNEVAPAQHELALIFNTANITTDHNQITMDMMKKIARRHGLVCLLHEKPFSGINGSGKHNNWSMSTDDGINLLDPGNTPHENAQFLVFLCAVIKAVDEYSDLLRASIASAGNDHRLGANEAPPAVVSIFLGDQLTDILKQLENGGAKTCKTCESIKIGVTTLPDLPKDTTDRNRTSPFAFTGNKFEFRMPGSSDSLSAPNLVLNTIVAESICGIADELEKASDINKTVSKILNSIIKKHSKIIFNGNNYSEDWLAEAEKRGLPNLKSTVESLPAIVSEKNKKVMEKHAVLSRSEMDSRYVIRLESYIKTINIEALTMLEIAKRQIMPAVIKYISIVSDSINSVKATGIKADTSTQEKLIEVLSKTLSSFEKKCSKLEGSLNVSDDEDLLKHAKYFKKEVFSKMEELRELGDKLETLTDAELWPLPSFGEILLTVY